MIEKKFVKDMLKEHKIEEFVTSTLKNVGHSHTKLVRTPLGEKVIVYASRPGLVVGRKGENIKKLTNTLKKKFNLENPQIEISEVENINLDPQIVAERIASTLERFGANRFKATGHRVMGDVMGAGALGVEILISGKIPSRRAKTWRFYSGYLKKCGDISTEQVRRAQAMAVLKTGKIGVKVAIMPGNVKLPDDITAKQEPVVEEVAEEEEKKTETVEEAPEEIKEEETSEEKKE